MKAQALIIQFMVFFSIGLLVFTGVSNVFSGLRRTIEKEVYRYRLNIVKNFFDSAITFSATNLRDSSYNFTIVYGPSKNTVTPTNYWKITKLANRPDFYVIVDSNGFKVESPVGEVVHSDCYYFNNTFIFDSSKLGSDFRIAISYDLTNNILVMRNA